MSGPERPFGTEGGGEEGLLTLADFSLHSEPGNEREAMERVAKAVRELSLPPARLQKLKTAVAEATMNAMEHGNGYRPEATVGVRVLASAEDLFVRITDRGGGPLPAPGDEAPDLEARLEGREALGAVPDPEHGGRDERDYRRGPSRRRTDPAPERRRRWRRNGLRRACARGTAPPSLTFAARSTASRRKPSPPPTTEPRRGPGGHPARLRGVDYIDSTGIALIVGLLAKARISKRRIVACALSEHYVRIFDITRLSDFVGIYEDEESALREAAKS